MTVFVNFNNYLGGGETLLLRISKETAPGNSIILSSKNSYIESSITTQIGSFYEGDYSYHYLNKRGKENLFRWIENSLPKGNLRIVTFCMRDLHIMNDYLISRKDVAGDTSITHLLLHPLDHLYLCQSLKDKIVQRLTGIVRYSDTKNAQTNANLLSLVSETGSLIPMNENVLNRLGKDSNIELDISSIVPLPYMPPKDSKSCRAHQISKSVKIVWMGRIVDFKLPAILAMIDYVAKTDGVEFHIIGYGNERAVNNHIKKRNIESKVRILGKVDPERLAESLSEYDVGYAMGTSVIELTAHGLPTIVALAKPNYQPFNEPICAGLVFEQGFGNVGDDLYSRAEAELPSIEEKISQILEDAEKVNYKSTSHIREVFNFRKNIEKYHSVILNSKTFRPAGSNTMRISILKKLVFRLV